MAENYSKLAEEIMQSAENLGLYESMILSVMKKANLSVDDAFARANAEIENDDPDYLGKSNSLQDAADEIDKLIRARSK